MLSFWLFGVLTTGLHSFHDTSACVNAKLTQVTVSCVCKKPLQLCLNVSLLWQYVWICHYFGSRLRNKIHRIFIRVATFVWQCLPFWQIVPCKIYTQKYCTLWLPNVSPYMSTINITIWVEYPFRKFLLTNLAVFATQMYVITAEHIYM